MYFALQAAGIFSIDGRIVGDDQAFDDEVIGRVGVGLSAYGYAAPVGALESNEDLAALMSRQVPRACDTHVTFRRLGLSC